LIFAALLLIAVLLFLPMLSLTNLLLGHRHEGVMRWEL
jgi:hypothetical protein